MASPDPPGNDASAAASLAGAAAAAEVGTAAAAPNSSEPCGGGTGSAEAAVPAAGSVGASPATQSQQAMDVDECTPHVASGSPACPAAPSSEPRTHTDTVAGNPVAGDGVAFRKDDPFELPPEGVDWANRWIELENATAALEDGPPPSPIKHASSDSLHPALPAEVSTSLTYGSRTFGS